MRVAFKICILLLAALLPSVGVSRHARTHAPVQFGTPSEFWLLACNIDPIGDQERQQIGFIYPRQGDWAIYYALGYHDIFLYRVHISELSPSMPEVIRRLKAANQQGDLYPLFKRIADSDIERFIDNHDVRGFVDLILKTRHDMAQEEGATAYSYLVESERHFAARWERAKYYWVTLAFESIWLGGVVLFAGVPWILKSSTYRWAIHLGLVPMLLFAPHFLGYAPYTFTSAFPAGGVFYPYVLVRFRALPWTALDSWLLQFLPQICEPVAQSPGPMLAMTGMGGVGPVAIFGLGIVIAMLTIAAARTWRRIRKKFLSTDRISLID